MPGAEKWNDLFLPDDARVMIHFYMFGRDDQWGNSVPDIVSLCSF